MTTKPKLFADLEGRPAFESSVCVFLDVLGFVETQKASFKSGDGQLEFQRFYSTVRRELEVLNDEETEADSAQWRLKVFTDNIVLGYPLRQIHHESVIGRVAMRVSRYQLGMAREGYFVRGGFAFDRLFMDDFLAYGPALLEAYSLEHEVARDPRIVVSSGVRALLKEHFSYYADPEGAPQNSEFLLDSDGQIFLNYLDPCFEAIGDVSPDTHTLLLHKDHIERGLRDYEPFPRVWSKYAWLATYHDAVIRDMADEAGLDGSFFVDAQLHRLAPVKISPFMISRKGGA